MCVGCPHARSSVLTACHLPHAQVLSYLPALPPSPELGVNLRCEQFGMIRQYDFEEDEDVGRRRPQPRPKLSDLPDSD
jgi:hypothetical protein